ncbi:unnamed protein product [Rhizoctonia solani]|uniref:Transmembrane protein n=1 Tax=Rhizoctonia solani TaxID=456999 RepID=A0A8H3CV08_9AGAM|nr:unnamed protein product [Rhizoctonia solani]
MLAGLFIPQAIHYLHNGYCVLGITRLSSILLLSYDICLNLFFTMMFVAPLVRATIRSAWLRKVAIRSTIASLIALVTTSTNGVLLYVLDGNETIWVCFGYCAADIVINAVVLYWDLQGPGENSTFQVKGVYFSSIGGIPTFQVGTVDSLTASQDRWAASHISSHQYNPSEATVAVSHLSIPSLEKPKPTAQNLGHHIRFVQSPSRKRLSLPLVAEKSLGFKNSPSRKRLSLPLVAEKSLGFKNVD